MAKIVTITNPLTGQPAQVDQLDHTAQQIDDGLNIARGVSNPNLLDNWYFGNPVDQRQGRVVKPNTTYYSDNTLTTAAGTTNAYVTAYRYATGTASGVNYASFKLTDTDAAPTYYAAPENVVRGYTGAGYGPDRWKMWIDVDTILIEQDGLLMDATNNAITFSQKAEAELLSAIAGKTVTMSILYTAVTDLTPATAIMVNTSDGVVNHLRLGTNAGVTDCRSATFTFPSNAAFPCWAYVAKGQKIKIHGIGFELGSQQTLAHQENGVWVLNEIPDYGEQLRRCQRYFYKTGKVFLTGGADSATKMFFSLDSCNHMRKKPSVSTFKPVYVKGGGIYKASPTVSSVATEGNPDGFYLAVTFGDTGISAYNNVYCYATSLELTADL